MAFRQLSTKSMDGVCDLCCRETTIWAIGPCDHPICHLCAIKMRLLCGQNECAVCRSDMKQVVLVVTVRSFKNYKLSDMKCDDHSAVYFQNDTLMKTYHDVQRYMCPKCDTELPSMRRLNTHTKKEHGLHYCDICLENLNLFPFERKLYSHTEWVRHCRKGDPDDTSHKGHPNCKFCDQRYFDSDQLHSHLHKVHFWCHFCECDGKQDYYINYNELKRHFKSQHYLCETDECAHKELEAAFKTKIDYQAHLVSAHSQKMSKSQSKQSKQIEQVQLGFRYNRSGNNGNHEVMEQRSGDRGKPINTIHKKSREDDEVSRAIALSLAEKEKSTANEKVVLKKTDDVHQITPAPEPPPGFKKKQDNVSETDFPTFVKTPETVSSGPSLPYRNVVGGVIKQESFPALGGNSNSSSSSQESKPIGPPPGFRKKMKPNSAAAKPQPETKETFVVKLRRLLGNGENFEQFKTWSSDFRMEKVTAEEYENNCLKLFGDVQWNNVFDELVATFPDKKGRDNLIKAHHSHNVKSSYCSATKKSKQRRGDHQPSSAWGSGNHVGDRMNNELYPPLCGDASSTAPASTKWGYKLSVK